VHELEARQGGVPSDAVIDAPAALQALSMRRYGTVMIDPMVKDAEALASLLAVSMDARAAPLLSMAGPGMLLELRSLCRGTRVVLLPASEERVLKGLWGTALDARSPGP